MLWLKNSYWGSTLRVTAVNMCILWIVDVLNWTLGRSGLMYAYIPGLWVAFAGLYLRPRVAIPSVLLTGLLWDATRPVAYGFSALLWSGGTCLVLYTKEWIDIPPVKGYWLLAQLANCVLSLALYLAFWPANATFSLWHVAQSLGISQLLVLLMAPWFYELQLMVLPPQARRA
jgi:hypothetical protein